MRKPISQIALFDELWISNKTLKSGLSNTKDIFIYIHFYFRHATFRYKRVNRLVKLSMMPYVVVVVVVVVVLLINKRRT